LSGNYTQRDQDASPYRAIQVPEREAYARLDWVIWPNWNWNVQANWIGERPRREGDSRPDVDAYWLTDTTLRYAGWKHWEVSASLRNLFDADARAYTGDSIADDLPLPERNFYAEARYRF
jgi:iron complex outermembrane receptor protein